MIGAGFGPKFHLRVWIRAISMYLEAKDSTRIQKIFSLESQQVSEEHTLLPSSLDTVVARQPDLFRQLTEYNVCKLQSSGQINLQLTAQRTDRLEILSALSTPGFFSRSRTR